MQLAAMQQERAGSSRRRRRHLWLRRRRAVSSQPADRRGQGLGYEDDALETAGRAWSRGGKEPSRWTRWRRSLFLKDELNSDDETLIRAVKAEEDMERKLHAEDQAAIATAERRISRLLSGSQGSPKGW